MEKENWIQNVMNSTNGMTAVAPSDDLFFKIQQKIKQQEKVSPKIVWLVAASIAVLVMINFSMITKQTKTTDDTATVYFENTLNKSNQLY